MIIELFLKQLNYFSHLLQLKCFPNGDAMDLEMFGLTSVVIILVLPTAPLLTVLFQITLLNDCTTTFV